MPLLPICAEDGAIPPRPRPPMDAWPGAGESGSPLLCPEDLTPMTWDVGDAVRCPTCGYRPPEP